jgi:hypothetical protein
MLLVNFTVCKNGKTFVLKIIFVGFNKISMKKIGYALHPYTTDIMSAVKLSSRPDYQYDEIPD